MILGLIAVTMTAGAWDLKVVDTGKLYGTVTFAVGGAETTTADEGQTVTVKVTPNDGFVLKTIGAKAYTSIDMGRAASVDVLDDITLTKSEENVYTFIMPRASVKVSADCEVKIPDEASSDGVMLNMSLVEGVMPSTDSEGVTHYTVKVDSVTIPVTTTLTEITVTVPATNTTGKSSFAIAEIGPLAFMASMAGNTKTKVTRVVLPETTSLLKIAEGAMKPDGQAIAVQTPLALLDDYALATPLKENFEAGKVSAIVEAPNRYWTFSCGVDVKVPEGILVYGAYNKDVIRLIPIEEVRTSGVVKANNGVVMACQNGKGGDDYELVVVPGRQKSGTTPSTTDADSYEENVMAPVIEAHHYESSEILILKDGELHTIASSTTDKVPACKAVYSFSK